MGEEPIIPRKEVWLFALAMEKKLRKNDHKGHWSGESDEYLFGRLHDEYLELGSALIHKATTDPEEIRDEAVDVANFAMMIFDNTKPQGGE